ncbi:MAG: UDP-glucose--hexose-1-phosphate uridylyltransferase [Proteobacteria bacterium]|nr:UDP-glucose--hexose-1-phosphate uridylyltransferase [Pseudomonadota bacterium]
MNTNYYQRPHRRFNPLSGEWLLLSPHRSSRPWEGAMETEEKESRPSYSENCYLCPGNARANQIRNHSYQGTYVFDNDFPAMMPSNDHFSENEEGLFQMETVKGTSRVICYSERHDLTLAELELEEIRQVVELWAKQSKELGKIYKWVQIFENKGALMGCSNHHPHGQVWASDFVPEIPATEEVQQSQYLKKHKQVLLLNYLQMEERKKERIIYQNETWVCLVPYWAIWPFETLILPKKHTLRLEDLSNVQKEGLTELMKVLLAKYDNIFSTSFPFSMGWHSAPNNQQDNEHWQLHAHYYPPLLRSVSVRKFMVGYEMLSNAQRDITPEAAAEMIRKQSEIHYKAV